MSEYTRSIPHDLYMMIVGEFHTGDVIGVTSAVCEMMRGYDQYDIRASLQSLENRGFLCRRYNADGEVWVVKDADKKLRFNRAKVKKKTWSVKFRGKEYSVTVEDTKARTIEEVVSASDECIDTIIQLLCEMEVDEMYIDHHLERLGGIQSDIIDLLKSED